MNIIRYFFLIVLFMVSNSFLKGQTNKIDGCNFLVIYEDTFIGSLNLLNIHKFEFKNDSTLIWSIGRKRDFEASNEYNNFIEYSNSKDTFSIRNGDLWINSIWGKLPIFSLDKFMSNETTFQYKLVKADSILYIERYSYTPIKIVYSTNHKLYYYLTKSSIFKCNKDTLPELINLMENSENKFIADDSESYILYNPGFGFYGFSNIEDVYPTIVNQYVWNADCKQIILDLFKSWY